MQGPSVPVGLNIPSDVYTQLNAQVNATTRYVANYVLISQGHHKHHGHDPAGTKMLHVQASMYRLDQAHPLVMIVSIIREAGSLSWDC